MDQVRGFSEVLKEARDNPDQNFIISYSYSSHVEPGSPSDSVLREYMDLENAIIFVPRNQALLP